MTINRRVVLSGLALPAAAGLGLVASPAFGDPGQPDQIPDPGVPDLSLPTFSAATHDTVLTEATAAALAEQEISFSPAPGSTEVPDAERPSTRLTMSVGTGSLDLLSGAVHFDGGFTFSKAAMAEQDGAERLSLGAFSSQLAEGVATAQIWHNGVFVDRIPAVTYDLTNSTIEIDGSALTLGSYPIFLTDEAVAAIQAVFPEAPLSSAEQFADGSAVGTFVLPSP